VGLQAIVRALPGGQEASPTRALELYRMHLYREGRDRQFSKKTS